MLKGEAVLKAAGMESCALHYRVQLETAKRLAYDCALSKGQITSDDVREEAERRGIVLSFSKNWSGSVFRGKEWEQCGFSSSRHSGSNGHLLRVWRLRNQPKQITSVPAKKQEPEKKPVFQSELFSPSEVPSYHEFLT